MAARRHRVSLNTLLTGELQVLHEWEWVEERFSYRIFHDEEEAKRYAEAQARRFKANAHPDAA